MKSKFLFWILVVLVFGALVSVGLFFLKTDLVTFFVIEGIALIAIVLFIVLYVRLIRPYQIISEGMDLLQAQDFSTRLRPIADSEANRLIGVFNRMMDRLKEERLKVREKNEFLDLLIQASPQGLILLDFDERITGINPAGLELLQLPDIEPVVGKKLEETEIGLARSLAAIEPGEDVIVRGFGISAYRCTRSSFIDRGFQHPFILIEELTRELLKVEKASYEKIIRMMAHEVNNSLGAVNATLSVIADTLEQHPQNELSDVLPAVQASFERCQHLGNFIHSLADVVRIPSPAFSDISANELVRSVDALNRIECRNRNIHLILDLAPEDLMVRADGIQLEQVLVNIIKNAYEAIGENGTIRITTDPASRAIRIENDGPPISDAVRGRLFTSFFTTKPTGQGIGLLFVREVLLGHGCKFSLETRGDWTVFEIRFPENYQ